MFSSKNNRPGALGVRADFVAKQNAREGHGRFENSE
jgi:hypothetical protein